jgi:hypothetical protein
MRLLLIAIPLFLFLSCTETSDNTEKEISANDLLKELMSKHDEVMPNTMVLENLKKKIKTGSDSLKMDSLKEMEIAALIQNMDEAIIGMRDWMTNFEKPADSIGVEGIIEYYRSEIKTIEKVKEQTEAVLPKAESALKEIESLKQ